MEDNKGGGLSWSQPGDANSAGSQKKQVPWEKTPVVLKKPAAAASTSNEALELPNRSRFVWMSVAGLVLLALILWAWSALSPGAATSGKNDTTNTTPDSTSVAAGGLTIPQTQNAGLTVSVTAAAVVSPTWVVVYESRDGTPGNALGAALFFPGNASGSVNLLRGTISGQSYFVGQRLDNGDRIFSLESDKEVLDQNGQPILAQFQTQ